ncbi:MAG: hypothetical protein ABIR60_08670 [Allosphingosinicella sp.]
MTPLAAPDAKALRPRFDRLVEQFATLRRSTDAQRKRLSAEVKENEEALHKLKSLETSIIGFYQELEKCDPTEPADGNGVPLRPRGLGKEGDR